MITRSLVALGTIALTVTFADSVEPHPNALLTETGVAVPNISSLSPPAAAMGASSVRLTVNGTNFTHASVVRWSGADRATTYVSATQLRAEIPASDLTATGVRPVTVFTPGGSGGTSNAAAFTVGNPVPAITDLAPTTAMTGGEQLTLVVTGGNFVPGATVQWGDTPLQTTFETSGRIRAVVPDLWLRAEGTAPVSVVNPPPLGGRSSAMGLPVTHLAPIITSVSPASQTVLPYGGFTLRVSGQNFIRSRTEVWWIGSRATRLGTTWISPTQLDATIPADEADSAGTFQLRVLTTVDGVSHKDAVASFQITNFAPAITSGPSVVVRGTLAPLVFTGWFVRGATSAVVNGHFAGRSTEWGQLTVSLSRGDTTSTGRIHLEITTPPPGGGTVKREISVVNPEPHILLLSPATVARNGPGFTLTVSGEWFMRGAVVRWNGSDRPTTYVSESRLSASIPASDITVGGTAKITVVNPAPAAAPSDPKEMGVMETMIRVPD